MTPTDTVLVVGHTLGTLGAASQGGQDLFLASLQSDNTKPRVFQWGSSADDTGLSAAAFNLGGSFKGIAVGGSTQGAMGSASAGGQDAILSTVDLEP